MDRQTRRLLSMLLGVLLTLAPCSVARAAAPRLVLITGGSLLQPIMVSDWHDAGALLGVEDSGVRPADLDGRPYLELALFWGPQWVRYVEAGNSLNTLQPAQANQHGRLYLPAGDGPAYILLDGIPGPGTPVRRLTPAGRDVLASYGVTTETVFSCSHSPLAGSLSCRCRAGAWGSRQRRPLVIARHRFACPVLSLLSAHSCSLLSRLCQNGVSATRPERR